MKNNNVTKAFLGKKSNIILVLLFIALLFVPVFSKNKFLISTAVYTFLFAGFGVSWNIIGGYGAQISWCHATFAACGAYTSFLSYHYLGLSPFVTMPLGMILSFLLATLIGTGTFKLRGSFFSLATIALAEIFKIMLLYFKDFTGGSSGRWITYTGNDFLKLSFKDDIPFYYISLAVMLLVVVATVVFQKTKTGYYLGAIKGDEDAATTLGIETFKVKLSAFQLSAMLTSLVGTIYAFFLSYIDPYSMCSMDLSVKMGMTAIVGGIGTLWGPVLGSFILQPLTQLTNSLFANISGASMFMYAVVLILVVLFKPQGIIFLFTKSEEEGFLVKLRRKLLTAVKGTAKKGGES